jgi:hypothetical protein
MDAKLMCFVEPEVGREKIEAVKLVKERGGICGANLLGAKVAR